MKRSVLSALFLSFALAACGAAVPPGPGASAQPGAQSAPALGPEKKTRGTGDFDPKALSGTWNWTVYTTNYTFNFEGHIQWTGVTKTGKVTTATGKRFDCSGGQPCTENGSATLTYDGSKLHLDMTASTQNCPPYPGEPCETVTGNWLSGDDADGKLARDGSGYLMQGLANVDSRKPEIQVPFELRSAGK